MVNKALIHTVDDAMKLVKIIMVFMFAAYCMSGITVIKPGEKGIILRLGKLAGAHRVDQIHEPGWLFAYPYPVDQVFLIPDKQVREIIVKDLNSPSESRITVLNSLDPILDGYCITGDSNIIQADILVKYQVSDPIQALFGFDSTYTALEKFINDAVVAEMTHVSGRYAVDSLLSKEKRSFQEQVQKNVQNRLDAAESGVALISVEFREMNPPVAVSPAFEEVNTASINRLKDINDARSFKEQVIPNAESEAMIQVNMAQAYYEDNVARAEGNAAAFLEIYAAYQKAPELVMQEKINKARLALMEKLQKVMVLPSEESCRAKVITVIGDDASLKDNPMMKYYEGLYGE